MAIKFSMLMKPVDLLSLRASQILIVQGKIVSLDDFV